MASDAVIPSSAAFYCEHGFSTEAKGTGDVLFALRQAPPEWFPDCRNRLTELLNLKPNWDSYGAAPISEASLSAADRLMFFLAGFDGIESPIVSATPDGNVMLAWDDGVRSMDVEATPGGLFKFVFLVPDDESRDLERETRNLLEIAELLTRV